MFQDENLVSLSGAPIFRHLGLGEPYLPSATPEHRRQLALLRQHVEHHLGASQQVFSEPASQLQILHIPASFKRPLQTLVTLGMSLKPMFVPDKFQANPYLELMMFLPPDWRLDAAALEQSQWSWPLAELFFLAQFPHKYHTWLGWGHTLPNGEPIEAFASNTELEAIIVLPPIHVPQGFYRCRLERGKSIDFLAAVPIYADEMRYKLRLGTDALLECFDRHKFDDSVDIQRPSAVPKAH